jgi:hypothetical protein
VASYPSPQHAAAAAAVVESDSKLDGAEGVSLVGSCARRSDANDLDLSVLVPDAAAAIRIERAFHAFHRLYLAFQDFLQALFIALRRYPIAYDKWIREQVEDMLALPQIYERLPAIVGIDRLAPAQVAARARELRTLLDEWVPPP